MPLAFPTGTADGYTDFTFKVAKKNSFVFEKSMPSLVADKETLPTKLWAKTWHLISVEDAFGNTGTFKDPNLHARFIPFTKPLPVKVTVTDDDKDVAEGLMLKIMGAKTYK